MKSKVFSLALKGFKVVSILKGHFIICKDDQVGKKIKAFLFLSKARPKRGMFFRSPFSIWGQIFQTPFNLTLI